MVTKNLTVNKLTIALCTVSIVRDLFVWKATIHSLIEAKPQNRSMTDRITEMEFDDETMNTAFAKIVGENASIAFTELVHIVTLATAEVYNDSLKAGFPEERAWTLATLTFGRTMSLIESLLRELINKNM